MRVPHSLLLPAVLALAARHARRSRAQVLYKAAASLVAATQDLARFTTEVPLAYLDTAETRATLDEITGRLLCQLHTLRIQSAPGLVWAKRGIEGVLTDGVRQWQEDIERAEFLGVLAWVGPTAKLRCDAVTASCKRSLIACYFDRCPADCPACEGAKPPFVCRIERDRTTSAGGV